MSAEENIAVWRRWVEEGWQAEDTDAAVDELWAQNCVLQSPPILCQSADEFKQHVAAVKAAFPDITFSLDDTVAEGDKVGYNWTGSGTHQGDCMGISPTGKKITFPGSGIAHIVEGKIARVRENWDALGLMQQLGAIPK